MTDQFVAARRALERNQHHLVIRGPYVNEAIKERNDLDEMLFNYQNLAYLNISVTCLCRIPEEIGRLKNLTMLLLPSNQIEELPATINNLQKLQVLDCSHNKLKLCPPLKLPKLDRLDLSSNRLSDLVLMRANVMLSTLNLADNQFERFPDICYEDFTHLSELYLNGNMINTIPRTFKKLSALKILNLADNQFERLPDICYEDFTHLSELYLNGNMINTIPRTFKELSALEILNLADNNFEIFPDICCIEFANLSKLYLNGNKIHNIPRNIMQLLELTVLNLESNLLIDVPKELASCLKLVKLNLQQNNMNDIHLQELCSSMGNIANTKAIFAYVRSSQYTPGKISVQVREQLREKKDLRPLLIIERDDVTVIKVESYFLQEIRPFIAACIIKKVNFTVQSYKNFNQLHRKLQDEMRDFKKEAAIAIHDMAFIAPGNLIYTAKVPEELHIVPLSRKEMYTGKVLFEELHAEAEAECKIKKNKNYSKRYEYLNLLPKKSSYFPCLIDNLKNIISFPPIVSSNITKVSRSTKTVFVEVTSTVSNEICRNVLNEFLKKLVGLLEFTDPTLPEEDTKNVLIVGEVKVEDADNGTQIYPICDDFNDFRKFPLLHNYKFLK